MKYNIVIGSLLLLSTASAVAEYRETWVSPSELKSLDAGHKNTRSKVLPAKQLKPQASSSRSHDQQGRAPRQVPSDPIAAFARDDREVHESQKSRPVSTRPRKAQIVQQKGRKAVGNSRSMKAVTPKMA
ncbi:hypothetical protein [Burkholderia pyrrocinia]|uniref:hypothetical protein n=1 Tax=Burkholderia pyrrocinia TaxID=60550 RepID=UPI001BCF43EA|nr:hypothetical protein [Burkholderia pyrrocinia]QVN18577.1 hypothetical protein JYG32_02220 [Burkholderia pyrrocinia]